MSRRRDAFRVGGVLDKLAAAWQPLTPLAQIQRIWPEAVGEMIASWATPISERDGLLTVGCRDAVTAQELELQQRAIVQKLARASGADSVREIRFVINGRR